VTEKWGLVTDVLFFKISVGEVLKNSPKYRSIEKKMVQHSEMLKNNASVRNLEKYCISPKS
jgi:hypothetical protein